MRQFYYQRILYDTWHYQCQVLGEDSCAERSFADWNMGFLLAQEQELHALLQNDALNVPTRYGPRPTIRPELMDLLL